MIINLRAATCAAFLCMEMCGLARAATGGWTGEMLFPLDAESVSIKSLEVSGGPDEKGTAAGYKIRQVYLFQNDKDVSRTVRIGFPVKKYYLEDTRPLDSDEGGKISAYIDGNKVELTEESAENSQASKMRGPFRAVYGFDLKIKAGERKQVVVEAHGSFKGIDESTSIYDGEPGLESAYFEFNTEGGALWDGVIWEAKVFFRPPQIMPGRVYILSSYPLGYKVEDGAHVWVYEGWRPTEGVCVNVGYGYLPERLADMKIKMRAGEEYAGKTIRYTPEWIMKKISYPGRSLHVNQVGSSIYLWFLRNEIYARHGYVFQSKIARVFFSQFSWYKENPKFSEKMLSEIEKENLLALKKYENNFNSANSIFYRW